MKAKKPGCTEIGSKKQYEWKACSKEELCVIAIDTLAGAADAVIL